MWLLLLLLVSLFVGASSSPYTAILALVFLAASLSLKVGLAHMSWFFFTLVIVYVGGMMVMFVYLSSLIQSSKVNLLGSQGSLLVASGLAVSGVSVTASGNQKEEGAWVDVGFTTTGAPLILFSLVYLLTALFSVYRLCQKSEGPMKSY